MEYGSRVLIISRLAAVHLSEVCFGKFGHLKDGSQSYLTIVRKEVQAPPFKAPTP